ncbi:MAG TPA: DUF4097 family beta strand repeat-containing protein [Bryobacteraceae bacterium]|nr:DUF4097 family beta strand repeat-containing protein [Bryobacteraceae bacterium]
MRRITFVVAVSALCTGSLVLGQEPSREMTCDEGWQSNDQVTHCEINETALPAAQRLSVDGGVNGGMSVKGWSKDQILVRAKVQAAAESSSRAQALARQIVIRAGGGRIVADGPPHGDRRESWSVSYEIFVPHKIDLSLKAHNGGIHIADVHGTIDFDALNGGVTLQRLAGNVRGHTTNGGLHVELAGNRWEDGQLDATTTNGGVSLEVPDSYSAHLETGTVNGHINIDFPVTVSGEIDRRLSINLGSGGPLVRAITTNGGVSIRRKSS